MSASRILLAVAFAVVFTVSSCSNNTYSPGDDGNPFMPTLAITVIGSELFMNMQPGDDPPSSGDPLSCSITMRFANRNLAYAYDGISIPSARVYKSSDNAFLGEMILESDWNGTIDANSKAMVLATKIEWHPEPEAFECGGKVYLDITIETARFGTIVKRTPAYCLECVH